VVAYMKLLMVVWFIFFAGFWYESVNNCTAPDAFPVSKPYCVSYNSNDPNGWCVQIYRGSPLRVPYT